jgi:hypothetical protein
MFKRLIEAVVGFQMVMMLLSMLGMLWVVEHGAAALGYTTELRMPVVFHAVSDLPAPSHLARR